MKDQHIRLKAVYELRVDESGAPIRYFIPAYQRGYRWNSTQVTQLLEDIHEFKRRKNPQPDFACSRSGIARTRFSVLFFRDFDMTDGSFDRHPCNAPRTRRMK